MTYRLTSSDLSSLTEAEEFFSTNRLLPAWHEIPEDFKVGNRYTRLVEAIDGGSDLPAWTLVLREGVTVERLNACVRAHLLSYCAERPHRIAGVGYMIACLATLGEEVKDG